MGTLAEKMALVRAEKLACHAFAKHLTTCDRCLSKWHKPGGWFGLCETGRNLRDASVTAARALAKIDPAFAKKYASLIA